MKDKYEEMAEQITDDDTEHMKDKAYEAHKSHNKMKVSKEEALIKMKTNSIHDLGCLLQADLITKEQFNNMSKEVESFYDIITQSTPTADEVYIIMSPGGGILIDFSGNGKCYTNLEKAKEALKSKNEWSKTKGYGTYILIALRSDE
jgi:hypothetical protein